MLGPCRNDSMHEHTTAPLILNPEGARAACDDLRKFLNVTPCHHPVRHGTLGSTFDSPEWVFVFMAVLAI